MGTVRVQLNSAGVQDVFRQWARNDGAARIGRVEQAAKSSAPSESGEHAESIHVEQVETDRPVWRVVADSDHSLYVEAATGHMARSLDAAGGA